MRSQISDARYMRTALIPVITQRVVVMSYRCFRTTNLSHLQGSRMEPICCPETSLKNYHYSLRNNPEVRSSRQIFLLEQICIR